MYAFGILVGTSLFVGWVGLLLLKKYPEHPPLPALGLYTLLIIAGGMSTLISFAFASLVPMFSVSMWVVVWIPTLYLYSQMVGGLTARSLVDALYASSLKTPARSSHGRGRTLVLQGHYEGAIQAFLDEFHARPTDPEPLMFGARLMADEERHALAVNLYREALSHFHKDTAVWSEAAWLLSVLLEERMNRPDEAAELWRQIARKTPNSKVGRLAGARLQKRVVQSHKEKAAVYEHHKEPLLSRIDFAWRMARHGLVFLCMVAAALFIGVAGYHWVEGFGWVDAILNASMILGGMGPVGTLQTDAGKLFASAYALFSGLVFIAAIGVLFIPAIHRLLHKFHIAEMDDDNRDGNG
jgi:tetratricopeptide (TPR) repeat protein